MWARWLQSLLAAFLGLAHRILQVDPTSLQAHTAHTSNTELPAALPKSGRFESAVSHAEKTFL